MYYISGKQPILPRLPCIGGDEGVGEVVEIGDLVSAVEPGERVVLTSRMLGTWNFYGIYHERDVHVISPKIPLAEAAMLTIAPCTAYRMLRDFRLVRPGETVIQNAANSPVGQSVIQLCKAWDINTFNIVANHCNYQNVKRHLLSIGATAVHTLEKAQELTTFDTALTRPVLGLNCLGGKFEDVMLRLIERNGTMVYYGCTFDMPIAKHVLREDVLFSKFHLAHWDAYASVLEKDVMMNNIIQLMAIGKFVAPLHEPVDLKDYVHALRNTTNCEAFCTCNYVFDFTLP